MNNLEPVKRRSMTSPRAKIGDVVILKTVSEQKVRQKLIYDAWLEEDHWVYRTTNGVYLYEDKDILKNLTTNVSYE